MSWQARQVAHHIVDAVYGAGGYKVTDFMKVGIPLIAIFCALSMMLIPRFRPFAQ